MRAKYCVDHEGRFHGIRIDCPGCKRPHVLPVLDLPADFAEVGESPWIGHAHRWAFAGPLEMPTFGPSIHIRTGHYVDGAPLAPDGRCCACLVAEEDGEPSLCGVCHSFVRLGRIQFLPDCTHALAGQTVDLPEIP